MHEHLRVVLLYDYLSSSLDSSNLYPTSLSHVGYLVGILTSMQIAIILQRVAIIEYWRSIGNGRYAWGLFYRVL